MRKLVCIVLAALVLSACSNTALKAGSSYTRDVAQNQPRHTATAEMFLSHEYRGAELNVGVRHMSDVSVHDKNGGVNGVFVEMRQELVRF